MGRSRIRGLGGVALLAAVAFVGSATPAEGKRFRAYVACGVADSTFRPPPSHACPVGDLPHAVLINRKRTSVRYRLCVRVPSGATYCGTRRARGGGRLNQRALFNDSMGQHVISWYVGGRLVGRWVLERTIGD
jgi:hypothetical protein